MTKYKEYVDRMLEVNKDFFAEFKTIHDLYEADPDKYQGEYNIKGKEALIIIKDYENKLCSQSEKAGYSHYTTGLAEKYQAEVKKHFPMIDHVGVITKTPNKNGNSNFFLKKISL